MSNFNPIRFETTETCFLEERPSPRPRPWRPTTRQEE